jgi:hypothetical protein
MPLAGRATGAPPSRPVSQSARATELASFDTQLHPQNNAQKRYPTVMAPVSFFSSKKQ